jgi:hypothetical protein
VHRLWAEPHTAEQRCTVRHWCHVLVDSAAAACYSSGVRLTPPSRCLASRHAHWALLAAVPQGVRPLGRSVVLQQAYQGC